MTHERSGAVVEHPERFIRPLAGRGFEIGVGPEPWVRATPNNAGWQVRDRRGEVWQLNQLPAKQGFVLLRTEGENESGRTMPLVGADHAGVRFLLLEDGRLFQIVHPMSRQAGVELRGWETPGAYLEARAEPDGWRLSPTVAAGGMRDLRVICILLAAELLAADEPTSVEDA